MRRLTSLLAVMLFFIWILPLGAFIKPSQEKFACGGQRAICLCSNTQSQAGSKPVETRNFQTNPANEEEPNVPSGSGTSHYYSTTQSVFQVVLNVFVLDNSSLFVYNNPCLKSIEHVPKV